MNPQHPSYYAMSQSWQGPPQQQQRGPTPQQQQPPPQQQYRPSPQQQQRPMSTTQPPQQQQHPMQLVHQQRPIMNQPQQQLQQQPPQQQQQIVYINCKVYLPDDEVRRFRMPKDTASSYNTVLNKCLYDGLQRNQIKLYYCDEDDDWVRITNDEEWKEAYTVYLKSNTILKFKIRQTTTATTTTTTTTTINNNSIDIPSREEEEEDELVQALKTTSVEPPQQQTLSGSPQVFQSVFSQQPALHYQEQNFDLNNTTTTATASPSSPFSPPQQQQQQPSLSGYYQQQQQQQPLSNSFMYGSFHQQQQQQQQQQPQFEDQLTALSNMGFTDRERNLQLLRKHNGELPKVVSELC